MKPTTTLILAAGIAITLASASTSTAHTLHPRSQIHSNVIVLPLPTPTWLLPQRTFPDLQKKETAPKGGRVGVPVIPIIPPITARRAVNPCRLTTQDVHIRKSSKNLAIGPKPKTTCTRAVTKIKHSTTLQYLLASKWHSYGPVNLDEKPHVSELETTNIEVTCNGTRPMTWRSWTRSEIQDGLLRYELSVTANDTRLNCSI